MDRSQRPVFFQILFTAIVGILLALTFAGCIGAPQSTEELVAMPEAQFVSWRSRLSNALGTAAYGATKESPANLAACAHVSGGLRALVGAPPNAAAISALAGDNAGAAMFLQVALGELQAWVAEWGTSEAAWPRIAEVLLACAEQIDVGAAQGLASP